jgi:hypothetical protein
MDEYAAPVRGSHFQWPAALLCAASRGAAVWTWMRHSYAWPAFRFHVASVDGLVVGAMGFVVSTLHPRERVKGRRAAA